jgi:hypothetical protein
LACSGSGQYVIGTVTSAIVFPGYVSSDYGVTFPTRIPLLGSIGNNGYIAISSSGQYVATAEGSNLRGGPGIRIRTAAPSANLTDIGSTNLPRVVYDVSKDYLHYSTKTFVIPHPTNKEKFLVHGCLEGPETGVYYRGNDYIVNNEYTEIILPEYASKIATDYTVQVTPLCNVFYYSTEVENNRFKVFGKNGSFSWIAYGNRGVIDVEPFVENVSVKGDGPYKWI